MCKSRYQQEWKCYAPSDNKMFLWKPAMNVVNVPGKYLRFTQHRTCLKIDMVEMMKCSMKMRCQKLPDKMQSFQKVSCSLAEVLRPEDLAVRQMLCLQIGYFKASLG